MGRKRRVRVGIVVVTCLAFLVPGVVGRAAISVCSNYNSNSWFAGISVALNGSQPHTYEGTSANMIYQTNALCSTCSPALGDCDNNNSSAWTMIASNNVGHSPYGWAQSGMILEPPQNPKGNCRRHFAQQMRDSRYYLNTTWYGVCIAYPGVSHHLWQQTVYNTTGVAISVRSNIDVTIALDSKNLNTYDKNGNLVATGGWSHWTVWQQPFDPQWEGETKWRESDVPGLTASKTDFKGVVQVQDAVLDDWHDTCTWTGDMNMTAAFRYGVSSPACNWFQSWTI